MSLRYLFNPTGKKCFVEKNIRSTKQAKTLIQKFFAISIPQNFILFVSTKIFFIKYVFVVHRIKWKYESRM